LLLIVETWTAAKAKAVRWPKTVVTQVAVKVAKVALVGVVVPMAGLRSVVS
jgi:hypothetical protein